jgi:BON domain
MYSASTVVKRSVLTLVMLTVSPGWASMPMVLVEADNPADRALAEQVYEMLAADPVDYLRHVNVRVRDGVVTLSGIVWDPWEIYRAQTIAARVHGVRRVVDQLELEQENR